jgi:hypothetical protein
VIACALTIRVARSDGPLLVSRVRSLNSDDTDDGFPSQA